MRSRLVIAALKGGSGKTIVSLGLVSAWLDKGYDVAPFKKGPDFIDAGWLAFAANRSCYNLDPFLMDEEQILESFITHSRGADIALVEGNRGLYDGLDIEGHCSTAQLAKLLEAPVFIIVDVTMSTRTVAAMVKGCQIFDPDVRLAGVVLNKVAGSRQETLIRKAIEKYCGIPVVGSIPKLKDDLFPERHMGLVPFQERNHAEKAIVWSKGIVEKNLDLALIREIATSSQEIDFPIFGGLKSCSRPFADSAPVKIGFIRDRSFWFYYPENLEALQLLGAELIEIDSILQEKLPGLDALYIGGGFPETQAEALAENSGFRTSLKEAVDKGLPVYAECGGFMYLGKSLIVKDKSYPMVGAIPVEFILREKPQGHGYTVLEVIGSNPYYSPGLVLRGHEFHYSRAILTEEEDLSFVFKVKRGRGIHKGKDGILKKNLLATYTHVHAAGNNIWARNLFEAASRYKNKKNE